jgi:NTP pyrophosphatase (non-canonical NTP hydrolase)
METREFQRMCSKLIRDIDAIYNINRDPQFGFTQMMEEVGELAKDINLPKLRDKEIDMENLKGEFADVFLLLANLAEMHGVDLEEAVMSKAKIIKARHGLVDQW